MKQKHLQFFLEITLPDEDASGNEVLQINGPIEAVEWLNQLKLRFPGLQATLSPLQKKSEPMFHAADSNSRNGRANNSRAKQLKRLPMIETMPEQGGFEQLTERQKDIVNLLFKGHSYDEIGKNLGISLPGTFEEPKAPVYVDGKLYTTLRGDTIVAEFKEILDKYVQSHYGAGQGSGKSAELVGVQ